MMCLAFKTFGQNSLKMLNVCLEYIPSLLFVAGKKQVVMFGQDPDPVIIIVIMIGEEHVVNAPLHLTESVIEEGAGMLIQDQ